MIDFRFKDNQEPSINANNLNAIVEEINSNEAKIKDVESEVAEIVIEHGGSIVVPNPEEEPTEMLNTVKINNDVFELGASGDTGIEVTQKVYNAMEEEGEIEADVNYFITDGERSNLLIDDSRTGLNNAWSAYKVNGKLDDLKASLNDLQPKGIIEWIGAGKHRDITISADDLLNVSTWHSASNANDTSWIIYGRKSAVTTFLALKSVNTITVSNVGNGVFRVSNIGTQGTYLSVSSTKHSFTVSGEIAN